jgi:hypothetical protein
MGDEYKFDICGGCEHRNTGLCDFCDDGDQFDEADVGDDDEPFLNKRKLIRIKEAA